jgi:diphthine-ammonia ligase
MRVAVLSSGGKDSTYAVWWAIMKGWDVSMIVTVRVDADDSMMFQREGTAIAGVQAAAGGIPWLPILDSNVDGVEALENGLLPFVKGSSWDRSELWSQSDYKHALWPIHWSCDLPRIARPSKPIEAIVSGALRSDYQRVRLDMMATRLGIKSFSPLWHMTPQIHMENLIQSEFDVRFTAVSAEGIDSSWLNRKLDQRCIDELNVLNIEYGINIDGEGGEFETTVLAAPWFKQLSWDVRPRWNRNRGDLEIINVDLYDPHSKE